MTTSTTVLTIGVSIAVPDPWGARLQAYRSALGDDLAGGIPTHITLMPPQATDRASLPAIEQHLAEASATHHAFRVHLRGTGTFRPVSPVVFVILALGSSDCAALASSVQRGPLLAERQFPYYPHVTVAHHQPDPVLDRALEEMSDFECDFHVDRFSLYVHEPGTGWVPTRDFALTAACTR